MLAVSWPENMHESDWGKTGNKRLRMWPFARIYQHLEYKGEIRGIEVIKKSGTVLRLTHSVMKTRSPTVSNVVCTCARRAS
jgi:hypothetical protein